VIVQARRTTTLDGGRGPEAPERSQWDRHWTVQLLLIGVGLVALVIGSRWLVDSAVAFARFAGISDLVIGLTVVAVGTSLPEIATSTLAAIRGERDIAVGNVIGSNVFNILAVVGAAGLVSAWEFRSRTRRAISISG
jgi:cation:H+ antiporter